MKYKTTLKIEVDGNSLEVPPMTSGIPQYEAVGGLAENHPGAPKGSDTVPAWLTPGEFVVNKEATDLFGPQIKKMNDVGREIQDGNINPNSIPQPWNMEMPTYAESGKKVADTSWITGDLISNLGLIESSNKHFNPNTASGLVESYGKGDNKAYGKYQWTIPAARSPGFGVKGFDPREVTEEVMREKTIDYLMGIQKHYPDWTPEQVLRAYNQGPGKTREMITGKWENDPRSKNYGKDILNPDGTKTFRGFGRDTKDAGLWGGITAEARDYPFKVLSGSQDARMPVPLPVSKPIEGLQQGWITDAQDWWANNSTGGETLSGIPSSDVPDRGLFNSLKTWWNNKPPAEEIEESFWEKKRKALDPTSEYDFKNKGGPIYAWRGWGEHADNRSLDEVKADWEERKYKALPPKIGTYEEEMLSQLQDYDTWWPGDEVKTSGFDYGNIPFEGYTNYVPPYSTDARNKRLAGSFSPDQRIDPVAGSFSPDQHSRYSSISDMELGPPPEVEEEVVSTIPAIPGIPDWNAEENKVNPPREGNMAGSFSPDNRITYMSDPTLAGDFSPDSDKKNFMNLVFGEHGLYPPNPNAPPPPGPDSEFDFIDNNEIVVPEDDMSTIKDDGKGETFVTHDPVIGDFSPDQRIDPVAGSFSPDADNRNQENTVEKLASKVDQNLINAMDKDLNSEGGKAAQNNATNNPAEVSKTRKMFDFLFGDLIDEGEIGRAIAVYLGSRALGYDHGSSIGYISKQYLKRVDAKNAQMDKWILANAHLYTKDSLAEFKRTKDPSKLIPIGATPRPQGGRKEYFHPSGKGSQMAYEFKIKNAQGDDETYWSFDITGKDKNLKVPQGWSETDSSIIPDESINDIEKIIKGFQEAKGQGHITTGKDDKKRKIYFDSGTSTPGINATAAADEAAGWLWERGIRPGKFKQPIYEALTQAVAENRKLITEGEDPKVIGSIIPWLEEATIKVRLEEMTYKDKNGKMHQIPSPLKGIVGGKSRTMEKSKLNELQKQIESIFGPKRSDLLWAQAADLWGQQVGKDVSPKKPKQTWKELYQEEAKSEEEYTPFALFARVLLEKYIDDKKGLASQQ